MDRWSTGPEPETLEALTFMSNQVRNRSDWEWRAYLRRCHLQARELKVSGWLLINAGQSLAMLEAPARVISQVLAWACQDQPGLVLLCRSAIPLRIFPEFSVGFSGISAFNVEYGERLHALRREAYHALRGGGHPDVSLRLLQAFSDAIA